MESVCRGDQGGLQDGSLAKEDAHHDSASPDPVKGTGWDVSTNYDYPSPRDEKAMPFALLYPHIKVTTVKVSHIHTLTASERTVL